MTASSNTSTVLKRDSVSNQRLRCCHTVGATVNNYPIFKPVTRTHSSTSFAMSSVVFQNAIRDLYVFPPFRINSPLILSRRIVSKQYATASWGASCRPSGALFTNLLFRCLALALYEYIITFNQELSRIWSRPFSIVTILWVIVSNLLCT